MFCKWYWCIICTCNNNNNNNDIDVHHDMHQLMHKQYLKMKIIFAQMGFFATINKCDIGACTARNVLIIGVVMWSMIISFVNRYLIGLNGFNGFDFCASGDALPTPFDIGLNTTNTK